MKLIIFAGGKGTRLWPLSRENSPKQFDKLFEGKSTLELAIDRVQGAFGLENIFIQTIEKYKKSVMAQVPSLNKSNIIIEPAMRNLGAAVCLSALELKKRGFSGPMAILWSDHLMKNEKEFISALKGAEKIISQKPNSFVFLAEKPRFANNNLGWIKVGDKSNGIEGADCYSFEGWKYKPDSEDCQRMFQSGQYFWNPGYFITSIDFLINQYINLAPEIYTAVSQGRYLAAPETHFDRAIIEKLDPSKAAVIKTDMGWSDPGTLYALKEALEKNKQSNVLKGSVASMNCSDCLFYNLENNKLVAAIGLSGTVVVNTPDAVIVVPKDEVVHITELLKKIKEKGLERYL